MESIRFDRITRELANGTSRRGLFKILAGSAVAFGVASIGAPSSQAQEACADPGDECTLNEDCCHGFYCNNDGVCAGAAECAETGGGCDADEACCGELVCGEDRTCAAPESSGPECAADAECGTDEICCSGACHAIECCIDDADPNARCPEGTACFEGYCDAVAGELEGTTSLPETGAGTSDDHAAGWLLSAATVGGAAALAAIRLRAEHGEALLDAIGANSDGDRRG
jgi:hypothetical protein